MLAFLGGLITGAVIVALTTPKSGPELREDIMDFVDDTKVAARKKVNNMKAKAKNVKTRLRNQIVDKLEEMADKQ